MMISRWIDRLAPPSILIASLSLLGPAYSTARGQWLVSPGWEYGYGTPFGGYGYGFGPTYAGVGYGVGAPFGGFPGYGHGYGIYPGAFSVLNQPDIRSGLAYNALATGRASHYAYPDGPFGGYGVGPYGYAGAAYSNPYFASGLTPLAVQAARDELLLRRAGQPIRFQIQLPPRAGPVD
ncbi:hypothetical protein [Tautonia plasticadhaerens]|uniref:Uncharacterized protein n=1 Tax=Tautonia plasticadhaerens TaxID=2527974 RepID=A0A518HCI4_9BACT|nr:hypothetical protein [Tautonia plasticadhaerens]QDV38574.1 hypothetical protein ElP_65290 [Tautonia plasticadhaerens]